MLGLTARPLSYEKRLSIEPKETTAFPDEGNRKGARGYAESIGLALDSGAVYCWDNPIAAGVKCKYTERDIRGYLDRYAKDGDITDVWIWYEQTGSGSYEIYIGYA